MWRWGARMSPPGAKRVPWARLAEGLPVKGSDVAAAVCEAADEGYSVDRDVAAKAHDAVMRYARRDVLSSVDQATQCFTSLLELRHHSSALQLYVKQPAAGDAGRRKKRDASQPLQLSRRLRLLAAAAACGAEGLRSQDPVAKTKAESLLPLVARWGMEFVEGSRRGGGEVHTSSVVHALLCLVEFAERSAEYETRAVSSVLLRTLQDMARQSFERGYPKDDPFFFACAPDYAALVNGVALQSLITGQPRADCVAATPPFHNSKAAATLVSRKTLQALLTWVLPPRGDSTAVAGADAKRLEARTRVATRYLRHFTVWLPELFDTMWTLQEAETSRGERRDTSPGVPRVLQVLLTQPAFLKYLEDRRTWSVRAATALRGREGDVDALATCYGACLKECLRRRHTAAFCALTRSVAESGRVHIEAATLVERVLARGDGLSQEARAHEAQQREKRCRETALHSAEDKLKRAVARRVLECLVDEKARLRCELVSPRQALDLLPVLPLLLSWAPRRAAKDVAAQLVQRCGRMPVTVLTDPAQCDEGTVFNLLFAMAELGMRRRTLVDVLAERVRGFAPDRHQPTYALVVLNASMRLGVPADATEHLREHLTSEGVSLTLPPKHLSMLLWSIMKGQEGEV